MDCDLKIIGAEIVDGSGRERYRGDGNQDRRIVALGAAPGQATAPSTLAGWSSPGFVDIHTHYDAQVMGTVCQYLAVARRDDGRGRQLRLRRRPTRPAHRDLIMRTLEKVEGMSVERFRAGLRHAIGRSRPSRNTSMRSTSAASRSTSACPVGHTPVRLWVMGEAADRARPVGNRRDEGDRARSDRCRRDRVRHQGLDPCRLWWASCAEPPVADLAEIKALSRCFGRSRPRIAAATIGGNCSWTSSSRLPERPGGRSPGQPLSPAWFGVATTANNSRARRRCCRGLKIVPQVTPRPLNFEYQFKAPFPFEPLACSTDFSRRCRRQGSHLRRSGVPTGLRRADADERSSGTFRATFAKTVVGQYTPQPELEERLLFRHRA